jgi:hypothetical protein
MFCQIKNSHILGKNKLRPLFFSSLEKIKVFFYKFLGVFKKNLNMGDALTIAHFQFNFQLYK